jgi:hypothetical protein
MNDMVSTQGFGPISDSSLSLYIGRWLDTTTGNIRVLPTASTKYLNPLSFKQKIAYHQARMLNLWNNIVSEQDSIVKLR